MHSMPYWKMEYIQKNKIGLQTLLMSIMVTSAVIKIMECSITIDKLLSTIKAP